MRTLLRRIREGLSQLGAFIIAIAKLWPEALQVIEILAGWCLVTFGIALILGWREIWLISAGLFCFSLVGWGHLKIVFGKGLYTLSRNRTGKDGKRG